MVTELASAYIPEDRRWALAHAVELDARAGGAVLFADISGFTPLTEKLARQFGPHRGAELLTRQLNQVYSALIDPVEGWGGSVIGFSGDAVTCWFTGAATQACQAAVACAFAMQAAMQPFAALAIAPGVTASLAIKTVVAFGPVARFVAGDPALLRVDVLAGATLDRMAAAEQVAQRGEVVVDETTVKHMGGQIRVREWRVAGGEGRGTGGGGRGTRSEGRGAGGGWRVAVILPNPTTPLPHEPITATPELAHPPAELVRPWLLPAVYERLGTEQGRYLAELRPATALFLRFSGLDFDHDAHAGDHLDRFVRRVQQVIDRYEGALIQLTTGDKGSYLYAAFGAPATHDDDTARAVAAALELRIPPPAPAAISQICIGISHGMMRTGPYGSATRQTYGVLGDETNMAARLMAQAEPGQILLSRRAAELVKKRFALVDLGLHQFKGKSKPEPIFAVAGTRLPSPAHLAMLYQTPIVGRDAEMAQLETLVDATLAGQGGIARIEGDAGVGKSHLVAHFARRAAVRGVQVVFGACQSTAQDTAYFALQPVLRALLELDGVAAQPLAAQTAHLEATVRGMKPGWLLRLPLLSDVVGLPLADNATTAAFDARLRREALTSLAVEIIMHMARRRPLLILVEDAHWMDEASQSILLALARVVAAAPCVLLFVHRPPLRERDPWLAELATLPQQVEVRLQELDAQATAALVEARLGGEVEALAVAFVQQQAQGNPFFAEELVDALQEGGRLVEVQGTWRLAPELVETLRTAQCLVRTAHGWMLAPDAQLAAVDLGVPASIHGLVLARLDRLPEAAKLTLKVASVIGRVFELELLNAAHPAPPGERALLDQFHLFQTRDFARLEKPLPQVTYIFKHNITQEAVYQTLLETQQHDLHLAVAHAIEVRQPSAFEQLAHHYWHSNLALLPVRERALHYLEAAAQRAQRDYANETALAYYARALSLELRWPWLQAKSQILHILGRRDEERAALESLAGAGAPRAEVAYLWGEYFESISEFEPAQAELQRMLAAAHAAGDGRAAARALARLGQIALRRGDAEEARRIYQIALQNSEDACENGHGLPATGEPAAGREARAAPTANLEEADARFGLGIVERQQGNYADAVVSLERALALYRQSGKREDEAKALTALGGVGFLRRDFARALDYWRAALEIRQKIGDRAGEGSSLLNIAQALTSLGDYSAAMPLLHEALSIQQALNSRWWQSAVWNSLGIVALSVGDFEGASQAFEAATALSRAIGDEAAAAIMTLNLGQVERERAADTRAEALIGQSLDWAQAQGDRELQAQCLTELGLTAVKQGNDAQAAEWAQRALDIYRELAMPLATTTTDLATLALCHLRAGRASQALVYAEQALAILDGCQGEGPDYPQRDYYICAQVLRANGMSEQATAVERTAVGLVRERAARISDPAVRQSYLEGVAFNREVMRHDVTGNP